MTAKEINQAIRDGCLVVLRDEPWLCIVPDFFGGLVVDTLRMEPFSPRKATLADKRQAVIYEKVKNEKVKK